ncbi:MAG: sulfatase [Verrucomicrobia bacterium]|nr:sulfatase [Verrucomicrobiota bacterium]
MTSRLLLALLLAPLAASPLSAATPARPNIVIIFTDDQGYGDLGCYGSPDIATPHIDRLAAEGLRFTSFYAATFCGPSRAQLMTGCYAARVGHARNPGPGSNWGLHPAEVTIAEVLKQAGYATMAIGKWHLGDAPEFLPTRQGFDAYLGLPFSNDMWRYHPKMPPRENEDALMRATRERAAYTGYAGSDSYYPPRGGFPNDLPLMRDETVIETNPDQRQLTTRYTEAALDFISRHRDRPFFLYLAHAMPHVPLFVSEKFAGKSARGLYGDVVMEIDWSVGQILGQLRRLGLDERTLVVFTSDNGPWLAYGIDGGSAGPLREGKGTIWEGGVRVPAIFRWPGKIPAGRRTAAVAGNIDLLPTCAQLAGARLPSDRVIDGRDLGPLLTGASDRSPHAFFHYLGGSAEGQVNYRAIRDERWKLHVETGRDGTVTPRELYDLGADAGERFNRLAQHPEVAQRLALAARDAAAEMRAHLRPAGRRASP